MSSAPLPLVTVRYPTGETEHRTTPTPLKIGDVLTRNGDTWIVEEVTTSADSTVVVRARREAPPVLSDHEQPEPGHGLG